MKMHKKNRGFTIVEVLIVLAIAGLILLIVFMAVPALQRNSRNTQRRAAVANLLGGISEFVTNNNGSVPTTFTYSGGTVVIAGAASTSPVTININSVFTDIPNPIALPGSPPTTSDQNTLQIYTGAVCNGNAISGGGSNRSYVAWFGIEPNSVNQCQAS